MEEIDLVEVSFEVANKVGGIYQVLKSKSPKMQEFYGENYLTVGIYKVDNRNEFTPRENPFPKVFENLRQEGIECYYGVWEVEGRPKTILVDPSGLEKDVDELKSRYWNKYGINSLDAGSDFDEPLAWGYAVSRLIQELGKDSDFVTHLHEWLSGVPALEIDSPTVFTAHATVMGRALSNSGHDLSPVLENGLDSGLVSEMGVEAKHGLEKAAAKEADVFTAVSETTAREAAAVLEERPEMVLPNGLNTENYPSLEELSVNHVEKKKEVKEFLRAFFSPYYPLNLNEDPRIFFTSGRYEYRNKGFDVLIEALSKVDKNEGDNIYFFFFVPSDVKQPKSDVLKNVSLYNELEKYVDSKLPGIRENILDSIASGEKLDLEELLKASNELESLQNEFRAKEEKPPLSAFELNYSQDDILNALKEEGLTNSKDNRVKIIFYPTYLSVGDRMLSMSYEDAVVASSAGFFPSYYEPWGYTPVETAASGALSLTTDMAGFGKFLLNEADSEEVKGVKVLQRENKEREEVVDDLAETIEEFASYDKTEITERKHNARKLAQMTSWKNLGENYRTAHKLAERKNDTN